MDVLMVEPGAFYIMDRGYLDFSRLHTLLSACRERPEPPGLE